MPNVYYGNNVQGSNNVQQISTDYSANQPQQNYSDPAISQSIHAHVSSSQPVQNYPNAYGTYQAEASGHQYPVPSSIDTGAANYSNGTEMIQSHTKSASNQGFLSNYQYPLQGHNSGLMQYPNYSQAYASGYSTGSSVVAGGHNSSLTDSYRGHPGYAFDPTSGGYSYSSGYQETQVGTAERSGNEGNFTLPPQSQIDQQIYGQHDGNSRYTSASNGATTNLTTSSQYSNGSYQSPATEQNYYNPAYGTESEIRSATSNENIENNAKQTEVTEKVTEKSDATKSNLDLLAELDITINHAPLVPEVHSVEKVQKDTTEPISPLLAKNEKRQDSIEIVQAIEDKHENLQIVWDTWYTDVQPKRDPLGDPIRLQKFLADIEKYEKFVDSLTVKTLSGSTNLDIKWNEINDVEVSSYFFGSLIQKFHCF